MATTTLYTCDRCSKQWTEEDKDEQPVGVGIVVGFGKTSVHNYQPINFSAMWCRTCVIDTGIHPPITTDEEKRELPKLSFEEKLAELISELGFIQEV